MNYTELEKQFKEECTVINLDIEYPGNPSSIKWVIITSYSREELESKYKEILKRYIPYEISPDAVKDAIADFRRNEDKFRKRQIRSINPFDIEETVGARCPSVPSFVDERERIDEENRIRNERINAVRKALACMTETQRRRFILHYSMGKTTREIADMEGIMNHRAVCESINAAKKKFVKTLHATHPNAAPLSKYNEEVVSLADLIASLKSKEEKR